MGADVVYELARFNGESDVALLLDWIQLISTDGAFRLRHADGSETPCEGSDVVAVISSTPLLRDVRVDEENKISCDPQIAAELPLILKLVVEESASESCVEVNGESWGAYRTPEDEYVLLPSGVDGPDLSPCWAEYAIEEEGEWSRSGPLASSLIGRTSIGLATPGVVVEYASYGYGWGNGRSAVAIRPFSDVVTVLVDWLVNGGSWVLEHLWEGSMAPCSPSVRLFAEAARAADRKILWNTDMNGDSMTEEDEDEEFLEVEDEDGGAGHVCVGDADDEEDARTSDWASAYLELHLSDDLLEQVCARIGIPR